jgi:hypothetical protein
MSAGHEIPKEFVTAARATAADSFEQARPQLRAFARNLAAVGAAYAKGALEALRALEDDTQSTETWLLDMVAVGVGLSMGPLEDLVRWISGTSGAAPAPSRLITFHLDEASQAADPRPIAVSDEVHAAVKDGRVRNALEGLRGRGKDLQIPAENIRLTVKDGTTFVSLVGLGELGLTAGDYGGPVRIALPPAGVSATTVPTRAKRLTIGVIHVSVVAVTPSPAES